MINFPPHYTPLYTIIIHKYLQSIFRIIRHFDKAFELPSDKSCPPIFLPSHNYVPPRPCQSIRWGMVQIAGAPSVIAVIDERLSHHPHRGTQRGEQQHSVSSERETALASEGDGTLYTTDSESAAAFRIRERSHNARARTHLHGNTGWGKSMETLQNFEKYKFFYRKMFPVKVVGLKKNLFTDIVGFPTTTQ